MISLLSLIFPSLKTDFIVSWFFYLLKVITKDHFHQLPGDTQDNKRRGLVGVTTKRKYQILLLRVHQHGCHDVMWKRSIIIMTLFRCKVHLAGQRPTNWEHHLYHTKVEEELSHDSHTTHTHRNRYMSPRAYGLTSSFEKTRKSKHLQTLEQMQHFLLNYF